jgi:hypothetical protein
MMCALPRQTVMTAVETTDDAVDDVARALVAAGRVVPGLTVEPDGRARSWWWPLPAASHRSLIAGLVVDPSVEGQRRAAESLTEAVDVMVRERLAGEQLMIAGEVPPDLEDVFGAAGVALFPRAWKELRARCSCPDWENPCKHIAAVLYVFADQLDADPWLLLAWRGRTRHEILDPLRGSSAAGSAAADVAPWWPFAGDSMQQPGDLPSPAAGIAPADPARPDAVLDGLEVLDVAVAGVPFREAVGPAYEVLAAGR